MALSVRQLNRATLSRQLLSSRERLDVSSAVRRVVALQAQEPPSPYVALWTRLIGFDPVELDAAFVDRTVVKASLMRITLHAVSADDYPAFRQAMLPGLRAAGLTDRRFLETGLSTEDADRMIRRLEAFAAEPRTKDEIWAMLETHLGIEPPAGLWRALRICGALIHEPTEAPWSFGRRAAFRSVPTTMVQEVPDPLIRLFRRYLEGFGPASVADFARFASLQRRAIRSALERSAGDFVMVDGPNGEEMYDLSDAAIPDVGVPAPPRLLPMWDNALLAYDDRSRIIPEAYRKVVIRSNGDVLPTLLVDGFVAGVWRPVDESIEVTAFEEEDDETWDQVEQQATGLMDMLSGREHLIYSRYRNWWNALPAGHVRTFAL